MNNLRLTVHGALILGAGLALGSCEDDRGEQVTDTGATDSATTGVSTSTTTTTGVDGSTGEKLDVAGAETGALPGCAGDASCDQIDLLFVIDNSGTMGEEQLNLAANLPLLIEKLQMLKDSEGNNVYPDVNIMVTTTDFGHPLCTPFQKPDYTPAQGAPVWEGCNARINRFTGLDPEDPIVIEEACTQNCPTDIAPGDPFIHFNSDGSNVPNDDVSAALSCIGPQGIDGCGYEAPLEAMLQAINPTSCWNDPDQDKCANDPNWQGVNKSFLRPDATLAIAIITDEVDCSVAAPNGYTFFTDDQTYWETNPDQMQAQATSGVCWNAGVQCTGPDAMGVYTNCTSNTDTEALHPISRYIDYLSFLEEEKGKDVVMLGILGVPPVTEHNEMPPFQPTAGGVFDLVYREWIDGLYPTGDILPDEFNNGVTAADKTFEFGSIGPGCTGEDGMGGFTGQAIPPVRVKEVCESLNFVDANGDEQIRCCIESICDTDFSDAINCLTGIISSTIDPAG